MDSFTGEVRASTGFSGRPGDFQYNAARLSGRELDKAAMRY